MEQRRAVTIGKAETSSQRRGGCDKGEGGTGALSDGQSTMVVSSLRSDQSNSRTKGQDKER